MAHNAKKGGEIGANGEFYKGGQFVADSADTIKSKYLSRGSRKIEVEPYTWIFAGPDTFGIWQFLDGNVFCNDGYKTMPVEKWYLAKSADYIKDFYSELLHLYKTGRRTMSIVELANIRKRTNAGPYWINNTLDVREFATI